MCSYDVPLHTLGSTIDTSAPTPVVARTETPQHNRASERYEQTLPTMIRCMLKDGNGPSEDTPTIETEPPRTKIRVMLHGNDDKPMEKDTS